MCISSALLALVDADKQNYNAVMGLLWLVSAVGDRELSHIENSYMRVLMWSIHDVCSWMRHIPWNTTVLPKSGVSIDARRDFGRTVVSPLAMLWSKRSDGGHHDTVSAGETVFTCACRHHKETGF